MSSHEKFYGSDTPARFARGALVYFVVVGIVGTYLRALYVRPLVPGLLFANLVHAHSHVAYFGWASLGLMAVIYRLLPQVTGRPLVATGLMGWQLALTHGATAGALVAFAWAGYTPVSIVFSTMNVLLWYLFLRIYWLNVRNVPRPWPVALRYWHGAVFLLFVSSLGTWLISIVTARGGSGTVAHQAGLNIFLTNFTDGWLLLGLLGGAVALLSPTRGADAFSGRVETGSVQSMAGSGAPRGGDDRWAEGPLLWIVGLTPFTFLAELVAHDVARGWLVLGLTARFALAGPYAWFAWQARAVYRRRKYDAQGARSGPQTAACGADPGAAFMAVAGTFFVLKALIHLGLGLAPVVPARHLMIAYLHLDLLGFVSAGLLAALYLTFRSRRASAPETAGVAGAWVLALGTAAMVVTLGLTAVVGSAPDLAARGAVPDLLQAAFVFGAIALVGIVLSVVGLGPRLRRL